MRLSKAQFEMWLQAKPPDEIVGESRSPNCPLAKFYNQTSGGAEIVIGWCGDYTIDRGYGKRAAPKWAQHFIVAVDDDEWGQISAQRALDILSPTPPDGQK